MTAPDPVPKIGRRLLASERFRVGILGFCMIVPVVASIVAVHDLDQNTRRRMDASLVVASVVSTADELLFVEWQGITGSIPDASVHPHVVALLGQIDANLKSLQLDGVDLAAVTDLGNAARAYTTAITGGSNGVQVPGGQLDLFAGGPLKVLNTYEAVHTASDRAQSALKVDNDSAALLQDIGTIVVILAVCAAVTALLWRSQRRRRVMAVAAAETDVLRKSEERFRLLFERNPQPMWVLGPDSLRITMVNDAAVAAYGYSHDTFLTMEVTELFVDAKSSEPVRQMVAGADSCHATASHRLADGRVIEVEMTSDRSVLQGQHGILLLAQDVTDRNRLEEQLRHQAFHDPLTSLPNRALFRERVHHAVLRGRRTGLGCAVVILDLDDFKTVNDSLGHSAGDDLLVQVADRIPKVMRPGDTVARLGGDEFAILVEDVADPSHVTNLVERIAEVLSQTFRVFDIDMHVSASIGIAFDDSGDSVVPEGLIRNADVAMYAAKARGEGGWALFGEDMHEIVQKRLELRAALSRAVENRELVVHYQPIVDLHGRQLIGLEALVRWEHPTKGLLPPMEFITLAEETGQIGAIGAYVLAEAASHVRGWTERYPDQPPLELSVNVSFRELMSIDFVDQTLRILDETGLDPHQLVLEVTETVLMQDPERTIGSLERLRRHGIRIAMDDFGTGYSSLAHLRQLPLDVVKIDRSFVMSIGSGTEDVSMMLAIVRLLSTLKVVTLAEGIETPAQLDSVGAMGCDLGQGFLFAHPLPANEVEPLLETRVTPMHVRQDNVA